MQKRALEITCYVCGAGAFGVFVRWLQVMMAFDEAGLAEKSIFNLLVPGIVIAAAIVFNNFTKQIKKERLYIPKEFCEALFNPGRFFTILRWTAGGLMCLGAVLLLATSETDKNADLLHVLSAFGFLTGICFPLYLGEANYEEIEHLGLIRLYSAVPVVFYSVWLIVSYRENALNSVVWDYVLEIATIIISLYAFARVAGFAFYSVKGRKCLVYCMLGAAMCIMSLADERYMGEQLMLLATAFMFVLYEWIMIVNLKQKKPRPKETSEPDDGFDHLNK